MYLFHIKNPRNIIKLGEKPRLEEKGPYGCAVRSSGARSGKQGAALLISRARNRRLRVARYIKQNYKYDIRFSDDDSSVVTYKEWNYFQPVRDSSHCKIMFFRMNKAKYSAQFADCPGRSCDCRDDTEVITVVNAKFLSLVAKWTHHGLLAMLGQQVFETIEESFTSRGKFQRSVKSELLPELLETTFEFRRAVHASTALQNVHDQIVLAHGDAVALSAFTDTLDDDVVLDVEGSSLYSPAALIAAQGELLECNETVQLSPSEAALLLDGNETFSIFNYEVGVPLWISAARHVGLVAESLVSSHGDELAYNELVKMLNTTFGCGRRRRCEAKVRGITDFLYDSADGWFGTAAAREILLHEWSGTRNMSAPGCDVGMYRGGEYTKSVEKTVICFDGNSSCLLTYSCAWSLGPFRRFYGGAEAPPLNLSIADIVINNELTSTRNDLGIYRDANLVSWWEAYEYCNLTSAGDYTGCNGMKDSVQSATYSLPFAMSKIEGRQAEFANVSSGLAAQYQQQVCGIAAWLYEGWGMQDRWIETYVADYFNDRLVRVPYTFRAGALADLGYAQWGGGYITSILWSIPAVNNIDRKGYWKFAPEDYQTRLIEFTSQAAMVGYNTMNLSVEDSKVLLRLLASKDADAVGLRRQIIKQHTTYYCDGSDNGMIEGDWSDSGCERTTGGFFMLQNVFANFSFYPESLNTSTEPVRKAWWDHIGGLLSQSYDSNGEECDQIQLYYETCQQNSDQPGYKDWLINCDQWMTRVTNPTLGIYCDDDKILAINTPEYHNYQSLVDHPYPRKRGNVIAAHLYEWATDRVLFEERLWCFNPEICDYKKSGMFTEQRVRDVLFEGYTDPLAIKILNWDLAPRNLSLRCRNRTVNYFTEDCRPVYTNDCTEDGYEVLWHGGPDPNIPNANESVIMHVGRQSDQRHQWFSPEVQLPFGLGEFDNPAFAIYAGQLWNNSKFQKDRVCAHRHLAGPKNRYRSCTMEIETGRHNLQQIQRVRRWYGNDTLSGGEDFEMSIRVEGNLGNQFKPELWEGFKTYPFPSGYFMRMEGLSYKSADNWTIIAGDELLQLQLTRMDQYKSVDYNLADQGMKIALEYPTYYQLAEMNQTDFFSVKPNRYIVPQESWDAARLRAGRALRDTLGERYSVPIGMSSIEGLAGFPVFLSTPHHYGNKDWGGKEYTFFHFAKAPFKADNTDKEDRIAHWYFSDIEPISGRVVRRARRLQWAFRLERTSLFPFLMYSQGYCKVPTNDFNENGYGCFCFIPAWWVDDEYVLDERGTLELYNRTLLTVPERVLNTGLIGALGGALITVLGTMIVMCVTPPKRARRAFCAQHRVIRPPPPRAPSLADTTSRKRRSS